MGKYIIEDAPTDSPSGKYVIEDAPVDTQARLNAVEPMTWYEKAASQFPDILSPKNESRVRGFLTGAAAPTMGVLQAASHAPGVADNSMDEFVAKKQADYEAERAASGRSGFDAAQALGSMASPASIGAMKAVPFLSGASGFLPNVAQYAGNIGIGAATGAGLNALDPVTPQNGQSYGDAKLDQAKSGAEGGAIAAGIAAPLVSLAARGVGWANDIVRGRGADIKAANIARGAAGDDLNAIRAANAAASPSDTAAQAAAGVGSDTFSALGQLAKRNDASSFYSRLAAEQEAAQRGALEGIAGGGTQTAARDTRVAGKQALNDQFAPRMQWDLDMANQGKQIAADQAAVARLDAGAADNVQGVRNMAGAAVPAQAMADVGMAVPTKGNLFTGEWNNAVNNRGNKLVDIADRKATQYADNSLVLGEQRNQTQGFLDAVDRAGFKPLDTSSIVGALQQKLNDPTAAANKPYKKVLGTVANDIAEWTAKNGGQIDAQALYSIRKDSINSAIQNMLEGADPKNAQKLAAKAASEIKPLIDQAIVDAGGTAWPQTLKLYEKGMLQIDRQKMGATALDLFNNSKQKFVDLAQGNEPRAVEQNFGAGRYDFSKEMGGKTRTTDQVASEVSRDLSLAAKAHDHSGEGGLARIIADNTSKFRLPNPLNHSVALANDAISAMEGRLNKNTMNRLIEAMKSGAAANELMNIIPTSQKQNFLKILIDSGGGRSGLVAGSAALQ